MTHSMRWPPRCGPAARGASRCAMRHESELGLRAFLEGGRFRAFTDTFEDLAGLEQLPGMAVQRLMADGYGFGAEGDWKTAALGRAMKVMAAGLPGGTSFMEDYTYHLDPPGTEGARRPHAGDLPVAGGRPAVVRNPSAGHRRQKRSGSAGLHRAAGPGRQRGADRPGRSLPAVGQRGRRGRAGRSRCRSCRWPGRSGRRGPI